MRLNQPHTQKFGHPPLLDVSSPGHPENPFRDEASRWRNYILVLLQLFSGLRRGEALNLKPSSVCSGVDPKSGESWVWLNVLASDGSDDPRYERPGIKTVLSNRQVPLPPEVLRFCRARKLDYTLGVAPTSTLRKYVLSLEESTAARAAAITDGTKLRRVKEFYDAAASWDRVERIIARVEAGPQGTDTRFIVTSLIAPSGRTVYQDIYCARGQAENHIKAWKTHLAADRTSCCRSSANQLRLYLHVGAYWLMWSLRTLLPRRSRWRVAQFDTLRLRLINLAVRIEVFKRKVRLHLPPATPDQALFALLLTRMPRLTI